MDSQHSLSSIIKKTITIQFVDISKSNYIIRYISNILEKGCCTIKQDSEPINEPVNEPVNEETNSRHEETNSRHEETNGYIQTKFELFV